MLKIICSGIAIFYLNVILVFGQSYKSCIVTDLEHWGLPDQVYHGVPDYFSSDSIWVEQIKAQITSLIVKKFGVKKVNFLNQGVKIKNDLETPDKEYYLNSVDRTQADLFILISSYVSFVRVMSIEVEVEDNYQKRIYKRKSRVYLQPQMNETGIETNIDIGKEDFKALYSELLEAAFLFDKKHQNLGYRNVKRVKTTKFDNFLSNAEQCNIFVPSNSSEVYQIDFLGKRKNTAISIKAKNEREINSDGFAGKKIEKRGFKLITTDLLLHNWKVKYEKHLKKGYLFWNTTYFGADILSDENSLLGKIDFIMKDTLSASLAEDKISLSWIYYGSIIEIYRNQKLSALVQIPNEDETTTFIKFFYLRDLDKEEIGTLLSLFLLNQEFKKL